MPNKNLFRYGIFFLILLFFLPTLINLFFSGAGGNRISYSRFKDLLKNGNITEITISGEKINGRLKDSSMPGVAATEFVTFIPSVGDDELLPLLDENNVVVNTEPVQNISVLGVILNILPYLLFIWIGFTIYRNFRSQGQNLFNVGRSKAKLYQESKQKIGFGDVAGLESAKQEVMEIVDYLKNPDKYRKLGAETPRGILLVGPPGTGKTLIARAIAGEAGSAFYSISGSDFMEMFVGVGASRVRNLFDEAKKNAPSIIFIDELDSIGRHRGAGLGGGHDEREQTLNQMLSELDGFEPNNSTVVLAATNRPDILDPALLRPGRFDRQITVGMPSVKDREQILKIHARNKPLAPNVDLLNIAQGTPGFSGADLRNLLNEAALLAARNNLTQVHQSEIDEARDKVLMGLERKNLVITEDERKIIAYHESGHALIAALLPQTDPLHKVSIIPRDRAMGVTQQLPKDDKYIYSREYLNDRITVMLGGRAAEIIIFNSLTSGAANDLKEATKLARQMVTDWGMSEKFGSISLGSDRQNVFLGEEMTRQKHISDETAREIDEEIKKLLDSLHKKAVDMLTENKKMLDALSTELQEKEQLSGKDVLDLIEHLKNS
jgi:cell division protease FtsH